MKYGKIAKHLQLDRTLNHDKTKIFYKLCDRYEIREVSGILLFWTTDRKTAYQQWNKIKDLPLVKREKLPFIEW